MRAMSVARCRWSLLLVAAACSSSSDSQPAKPPPPPAAKPVPAPAASADDGYDSGALGALTFALSEGTPEARAHFSRGLLALHSFWYDEAIRQFEAAISADPKMRMAYWGASMSHIKLLWGDDDLSAAKQLLSRIPDPDNLPPREGAWVVALLELLEGDDVRASRKRFAAAMEQVHQEFPDDESTAFLSIALLATARPEEPDQRALRMRAADLALSVLAHNPKHPGAAHYAIHAFDTPELAPRALDIARAYAAIAPAAFHARHMPAHIFSRLGMWPEAIASCQAAWDVSVAAARRAKLSVDHDDFHSLNWLVEMNFEIGHRKDADRALALFAQAVREGASRGTRSQYALQITSYLMRTGEWSRVDELLAPLEAPAVDAPAADGGRPDPASTHCGPSAAAPALLEQFAALDARALAAAMRHDVAETRRWMAQLDDTRVKLRPFLVSTQPASAVAKLDAEYARHRRALDARAKSDDRMLLKVLRESIPDADLEEAGGETIQRGFLVREQVADILLRLDQPKEAAAEFERVLASHPGRAHAMLGAARAAARAKDPAASRARYEQLLRLWATADPSTDGLAEARSAAANKP
jgi:tetratricopeptide (TPR) repeat protein